MEQIMNFPGILSLCALLCLWAAARLGVFVRGRLRAVDLSELDEFGTVLGATLTLLGLLIGFTFSMAISRYDQRKNYEEEEANAIGTEYVRADLLPEPARTKVQAQLVQYLDLRIQRYNAHATDDVSGLAARTADSQNDHVERNKKCGKRESKPDHCHGGCRNERRSESSGVYPGCPAEPNPRFRLGANVCNRIARQLSDRFHREKVRQHQASDCSSRRLDIVPSHCRHR